MITIGSMLISMIKSRHDNKTVMIEFAMCFCCWLMMKRVMILIMIIVVNMMLLLWQQKTNSLWDGAKVDINLDNLSTAGKFQKNVGPSMKQLQQQQANKVVASSSSTAASGMILGDCVCDLVSSVFVLPW